MLTNFQLKIKMLSFSPKEISWPRMKWEKKKKEIGNKSFYSINFIEITKKRKIK